MPIPVLEYPAVLTAAAWKKHKGIVAKLLVGKTDVGPKLVDLESAFKDTFLEKLEPFDALDPQEYRVYSNKIIKTLQAGTKKVNAALSALKIVATSAKEALKSVPAPMKAAAKHIDAILDELKPFKARVDAQADVVETALTEAYHDQLKNSTSFLLMKQLSQRIPEINPEINSLISELQAAPTLANVHTFFYKDGPHRQLPTLFKIWDARIREQFPVLSNKLYSKKAMELLSLPCISDAANENNYQATKRLTSEVEPGVPEADVVLRFCRSYRASIAQTEPLLAAFLELHRELSAVVE